jgi:hypothetical protein
LLDDGALHLKEFRLDACPEISDLGVGGRGGADHLQQAAGTRLDAA